MESNTILLSQKAGKAGNLFYFPPTLKFFNLIFQIPPYLSLHIQYRNDKIQTLEIFRPSFPQRVYEMADLYHILGMITRGDHHDASVELTRLLQNDPQNVQAWSMLALAVREPQRKIDCYKRVLQLEPGNNNAISQLKNLGAAPENASAPVPPPAKNPRFQNQLPDH